MRIQPSLIARLFFTAFCLLSLSTVKAQANKLDSLEQLLKRPGLSTQERIHLYDDLSWEYQSIHADNIYSSDKGTEIHVEIDLNS